MTLTRRATQFASSVTIAGLIAVSSSGTPAAQASRPGPQHHDAAAPGGNGETLIKVVREATEKYQNVAAAEADGYALMFGCVSGPDDGAMGLHYVNLSLVVDGVLDPRKPEIIIYEPQANGRLQMIGADFLVFKEAWHAANTDTPQLMGQLLHLFESPNRFGLPDFYTLHVWAWKQNPKGAFVNWHPRVSCDAFAGGR